MLYYVYIRRNIRIWQKGSMTNLGKALSSALFELEISEKEFAIKTGIGRTRLNKIKNGKLTERKSKPTADMLGKIVSELTTLNEHHAASVAGAAMQDMIDRAEIPPGLIKINALKSIALFYLFFL